MVPIADASGLVAPNISIIMDQFTRLHMPVQAASFVPRPVLTAERPSQTMAQMGPLSISGNGYYSQMRNYSKVPNPKLTSDETLVERLVRQILVVLLEMFLRGRDQLHRCELVPVIAFNMRS